MKYLFFILTFILFSNSTFSQIVTIPDSIFKAYLIGHSGINTNSDTEIQVTEAAAFSGTIDVYDLGVSDMTGISSFTALTRLDFSGYSNSVLTIDLSSNTALTYIDGGYNQIDSINVSGLSNLDSLGLISSSLASLDLSSNTGLKFLDISYTSNSQFSNLDLSNNTALVYFKATANYFTTLDLTNNTALTYLDCGGLGGAALSSLNLSTNTLLEELDCYNANISSLNLSTNTLLTKLNIKKNQLTNLDVSNNPLLRWLDFSENQISAIDISMLDSLTFLNCSENLLTSLDVTNNTILDIFYCRSNTVSSLDVSNNTLLTIFLCDKNDSISTLDVSNNLALKQFWCHQNNLSSLDVSNNLALENFYCSLNKITSLDVSSNTALTRLFCNDNMLSSLNAKNTNNSNFTHFYAGNNPNLSCIEVDDVTYSINNWTNIDPASSFSLNCSTNISNISEEIEGLQSYPNPTKEELTIDLGKSYNETLVVIYNAMGQSVFSQTYTSAQLIDLRIESQTGLYLIKVITDENKEACLKIIKE